MLKDITFFLIRHGETQWNKLDRFQGTSDSPLTELGIKQAQLAGRKLTKIEFKAAYSSYQKRAIDTAKNIIQQREIPLFLHEGLVEIGFGKWEGQWVPNYHAHPDFIDLNNNARNYSTKENGGETFESMFNRSYKAIQDIIQIHQNGNLLVVSHGSLLRQLIYALNGGNWQDHLQNSEKLGNTSINIIHYQQQTEEDIGKFTVKNVNDTSHLN